MHFTVSLFEDAVSITSTNKKIYGQIKTRVNPSQDQDNVGSSYLNR